MLHLRSIVIFLFFYLHLNILLLYHRLGILLVFHHSNIVCSLNGSKIHRSDRHSSTPSMCCRSCLERSTDNLSIFFYVLTEILFILYTHL